MPLYMPQQLARPNTVALIGDSITEICLSLNGTQNAYGSFYWYNSRGYWAWLAAFLRWRLRPVKFAGVSGEQSAAIAARFGADVISYRPGWCILLCGTNDVKANTPLSTLQANVVAMLDAARAANIRMVVMTIPPLSSATSQQLATIHSYNMWLKGLTFSRDQPPIVVDIHPALSDGGAADDWITPGTVKYTHDGTHPAAWGAARMGRMLADAISPLLPAVDPLGFSAADNVARGNLHPNPGLTGTSGGLANGVTGTSPTSVDVRSQDFTTLAGTVVSSLVTPTWSTDPAGDRSGAQWHQVRVTTAASAVAVYARDVTLADFTAGDRVRAECEFDMDGDWSSVTILRLSIGVYNAAVQRIIAYSINGIDSGFPTENPLNRVVMRTPEVVVPADATGIFWQLDFTGIGTFRYRRPAIRKNPLF